MKKTISAHRHSSFLLGCVALLVIAAMPSVVVANNEAPTPSVISVTDYAGRVVTLSSPAKRIVALAPHIVENIFSAGAGDRIVGAVNFSDYPEAAKVIEQVGSSHSFSVETVLSLRPDVVVVWSSGVSSKVTQQLMDLGLTVYIDEPRRLEDVAKSIRDMGVLTGNVVVSEVAAQKFLTRLVQLQEQYQQREPVSMFYQVWDSPLMTINGKHIISDVMALCGGENIFADEITIAPKINIEAVLQRNPQAIVASGMQDSRPDWLDDWLEWPTLTVVKNNNLFFVPPDLLQRHTVRLLDAATILCEQLDRVRGGSSR